MVDKTVDHDLGDSGEIRAPERGLPVDRLQRHGHHIVDGDVDGPPSSPKGDVGEMIDIGEAVERRELVQPLS